MFQFSLGATRAILMLFFSSAIVLLVAGLFAKLEMKMLKSKCTEKVIAKVIAMDTINNNSFQRHILFYPVYEFEFNGVTKTLRSPTGYKILPEEKSIGSTLVIYYEPENLSNFYSAYSEETSKNYSNIMIAIALIMLTISGILFYNLLEIAITQAWINNY